MPLLPRRALITACIALAAVSLASNEAFPQDATGLIGDTTKNWVGLQVNSSEKLRATATGSLGLGTSSPKVSVDFGNNTDALLLQSGTTGQRPTGVVGMIRYNKTINGLEAYQGSTPAWGSLLTSTSTIGSGIYLGTATSATNPQVNGDATTGLYSDTASTVSIATTGVQALYVSATQSVGVGTNVPAQKLTVNGNINTSAASGGYYIGNNKILFQPASDTTSLAVGSGALASQTATNSQNTAVGYQALYNNLGLDDTAVGYQAIYHPSSQTNYDTAIGYQALYSGGIGSTVEGYQALYKANGNFNVGLGYQVGSTTLTYGSNNILIGTSSLVDTPAAGTSNYLNIGNLIYGDMSGGRVSIGSGTINSGASLDISQRSDSLLLPTGTTGQRPTGVVGMIRYNSTLNAVEAYQGSTPAWTSLGGSGGGTLGTAANATSPQRSDDAGTGLYSDTATTVEIATGGTEALRVTATQSVGLTNATPRSSVDFGNKTDAILVQSGTQGQRPVSPVAGMVRYNTTNNTLEYFNGTNWMTVQANTGCGTSGTFSSYQTTSITVPAGCSVTFKAWGAGAGGGGASGSHAGGNGGGGGYATITIGTQGSATTYYLAVGGGGAGGSNTTGTGGSGGSGYTNFGGGKGGNGGTSTYGGGGGGSGASAVWTGSLGGTPVIVAAGGGGGAASSANGTAGNPGGAGSQTSGTAGATGSNGSLNGGGGGGGAGYTTGGAGGAGGGGAGGGGSLYSNGGTTSAGSGINAGNNSDSNYPGTAGQAGIGASSAAGTAGSDGAIYYVTF